MIVAYMPSWLLRTVELKTTKYQCSIVNFRVARIAKSNNTVLCVFLFEK
jgi:hypothetical protein